MIPARPGTYVLVLRCSTTRIVRIGRIGAVRLSPGLYLYVGSAFGPGGLRARIGHHAGRAKQPHWHVDYIRQYTRLKSVLYCCDIAVSTNGRTKSGQRRAPPWCCAALAVRIAGARRICSDSIPLAAGLSSHRSLESHGSVKACFRDDGTIQAIRRCRAACPEFS